MFLYILYITDVLCYFADIFLAKRMSQFIQ